MIVSAQQARFGDLMEDAKVAMAASPDYFARWYTIKSVGLGVVAAVGALFAGLYFGGRK